MGLEAEKWVDIIGFESLYAISTYGRVKSHIKMKGCFLTKEMFLKPSIKKNGYFQVILSKNSKHSYKILHRLVAIHFIKNPENKPQVNHKDCNKFNCYADNLEWCTSSENILHAYKNGLQRQDGEYHATKKLDWVKVREIRRLHKNGVNKNELANKFGVHSGHINGIVSEIYWKEK